MCSSDVGQLSEWQQILWASVNRQEKSHTLPTHLQSHSLMKPFIPITTPTFTVTCALIHFLQQKTWILPQTIRILPSLCFKRRSELIHILTLKMWRWWHMMTLLGCCVDACAVKHTQYFRMRPSGAEWTFKLVSIVLPHCSKRPLSLLWM